MRIGQSKCHSHSAGVYSTRPPGRPFAPADPALLQAELDTVPQPRFEALAAGPARVETWTVVHDAKGPTGAIIIGRLADGARFLANTPVDAGLLAEMQAHEQLGRAGQVHNDGLRNIFVPG